MTVVPCTPVAESAWTRRRLNVPRYDFAVLCEPPLPAALEKARQNHAALAPLETRLQGRTVGQMRSWTRDEVLRAARTYTAELLGESLSSNEGAELLFVGGHQPALFHPGVWIKNFAVHELAKRSGGISLNLSVDTDIMGSTRIRVPTGDRSHPRIEMVPFDADRARAPWEENAILDRRLFESFGSRVGELVAAWGVTPLMKEFWPEAVELSQRFPLLRDCLVGARSRIERRWGAGNLELPISRLCELEPFLWFVGNILAHAPRFSAVHNQVLAEYRQVNHIRSRTHPVAELKTRDGWFEAPFWVWRRGDTVRGRLFARQEGREVLLSDGKEQFARLPLSPEMDACCAVKVLRELPQQGIRLRARALTTTLFARLCLADLFVHGIGGAKYDEMTDRILSRFFCVPAPGFLTMTATLHASLAEPFRVTHEDEERLLRQLRDLRWNADRYLAASGDVNVARLTSEKKSLLAAQISRDSGDLPATTSASRSERRARWAAGYERFQRVQDINRRLAELATDQERRASNDLDKVRRELRNNALLQDREFAFCLYPADKLQRLMDSLQSNWT